MTRQVVQFLALSLCCYRGTRFVVEDDFPPMAWVRSRVYWFESTGRPQTPHAWGQGIQCPHCVSIYVSIALIWFANIWLPIRAPWLQVGAIAGVVSLIAGGFED